MELLSAWLERKYLDWQKENGRISMAKWAEVLGIDKVYLNQMMNGRRKSTTMQTAYQIGEQLNDFEILRRLCKKAGVPLYSPHDFRHTFAVEYLRNHPNIYTLQETLGHTTLDMVRQYLVISQSDIREAHRRASPVEHWGL